MPHVHHAEASLCGIYPRHLFTASDDCFSISSTWLSDESDLFLLVLDDDPACLPDGPGVTSSVGVGVGVRVLGPGVAGRELPGVCRPEVLFVSVSSSIFLGGR